MKRLHVVADGRMKKRTVNVISQSSVHIREYKHVFITETLNRGEYESLFSVYSLWPVGGNKL